ncbi:MAG: serine hydrolase [Caulobacterales bacterium]
MNWVKCVVAVIGLLGAAVSVANAQPRAPFNPAALEGVAPELDTARAAFHIPGMAVVVVADGRVVLAQGFGELGLEDQTPVNAETRFAIGSCSKAFTSFALALLAQEGRLRFSDPVAAHDPLLRLPDGPPPDRLTITSLLTQRSGFARHDFMWHALPAMSRADFSAAQAHLPTQRSPATAYGYTNTAYILAGRLVDLEADQPWEAFTRARIFAPLGMTRANFSSEGLAADANAARATKRAEGQNRTVPWRDGRLLGPAGSINATANDLGRWLLLLTNGGAIDGRRILEEDRLEALFTPTAYAQPRRRGRSTSAEPDSGYAMGWRVDTWRDLRRVSHTGAIDGFRARVTLYPDQGVGVAVMVNLGPSQMPDFATRVLSERVLGLSRTTDLLALAASRDRDEAAALAAPPPVPRGRIARLGEADPTIPPSVALATLTGVYHHPAYGDILIEPATTGQGLRMRFGTLTGYLRHWRGNGYVAFSDLPDDTLNEGELLFVTDATGAVGGFTAMIDNDIAPVGFIRTGPLPQPPTPAATNDTHAGSLTSAPRTNTRLLWGALAFALLILAAAGLSLLLKHRSQKPA